MRLKLYRGKWAAVWSEDGKTRRASLRTADRGHAERRLERLKRGGPSTTVAEIVSAYLEANDTTTGKHAWAPMARAFGSLTPDQITKEACQRYAARAGRSRGTVRRSLGVLKAALKHAGHRQIADRIKLPPPPAPRDRFLTEAEYDALLAGAAMPHVRLFITLALATAGRAGAVLEMTWDRVDFERGLIRLGPGNQRKGRATVPMTERARAALLDAQRGATTEHVIEWGGERVASVKKGFAAAAERAGLEGVTPHTLRHTAATWMAQRGVPLPDIAAYLGHTDPRTTYRVYAKYTPDYLRGAARALDGPVQSEPEPPTQDPSK